MNNKIELKQKLYQMFILGLEGENLQKNPNLIKALRMGLGGVIFFSQNIKTQEGFKKLILDIKKETPTNLSIKPFLSIDQEGGRVERTENIHGGKKYLSARNCNCDKKLIKNQTNEISKELKEYGINLNFAPVADINTNPNNPIIGERAFSDNPDEVIKCAKIAVDTYLQNGILPCLKHFPGHGDASVDSHKSLPVIDLSFEEMEKNHIKPFKKVDCPMIMVAHLHCTCFDEEQIPSSLSKNVVRNYLIEKLNYQGLIITDDMVMGGVLGLDAVRACSMAIKAGVNILLYRGSDDTTIQIIENLADLAQKDAELSENIEKSFEKISMIKYKYKIS